MDWICPAFLSGFDIDDGDFIRDEDVYDFKIDFMDTPAYACHHTDMKVSLLDIARPAKQKGNYHHIISIVL